jgi:hypothetical protein
MIFKHFKKYISSDEGLTVKPKLVTCYVTLLFETDVNEYKQNSKSFT